MFRESRLPDLPDLRAGDAPTATQDRIVNG